MSKPASAKRLGKRTAARIRAIRRRAAAWRRRARRALTLAAITAGMSLAPSFAEAQMGQTAMAPAAGVVNRAVQGFQDLNAYGPGWMYFGVNAADRGLGYNGSYITVGGYIPYAEDDLGGFWAADLRGHLSTYGGFFSNVGAVRKQFIGGTLLGVGVYWDYDGDLNQNPNPGYCGEDIFGNYGRVYNQVGVSLEWLTDYGNLRSNGYMPVGTTAQVAGAPALPSITNQNPATFYQNFVMCQYGLDAALSGADLEVGVYVPALADWAGMISVGGYALGNDRYNWAVGPLSGQNVVPWFGGVYTRLDMTVLNNWDFSLQANNDSYFDWTGFARLTYRMGGSRRRNVPDQVEQPMMRNEHIVRSHQTPILATNPDNAGTPWRAFHVNSAAKPGGNGTAEAPFQTVAQANAAATNPWDIVLVNRGLSAYNQSTGAVSNAYGDNFVPLAANQYYIGDGAPFLIPTVCCGDLNIAVNTNGTPVLSNPNGPSITLADGLVTNNFNIVNSAVGIAGPRGPAPDDSLSSAERGSLATNINIYRGPSYNGPTQGIAITNATGKADFERVNIGKVVTSGTTTQDWTMSNGSVLVDGGDPEVTFTKGQIVNNHGHILQVNDTTGGAVTLEAKPHFPFIENGTGILVENAAGDVTVQNAQAGLPSMIIKSQQDGINVVGSSGVQTFNDIQILAAGTNGLLGYAGVNLEGNGGSTQFDNLTISLTDPANTATGFFANNQNVLDVTGNSSVNVIGAPAISMTDVADANVNFKTVTSNGSPSNGVLLDTVAGEFNVATSLNVIASQADGFVVRNSPDLTVSIPVTNVVTGTGAAADGIVLQNNDSTDAAKVNLGKINVATANGTGLVVNNAGVTTTSGTISAIGGASIAANKSDVNIKLASATSANSTGPGLDLTETSGSVAIATTNVQTPTGNGINAVNNVPGFAADFGNTTVAGITNGAIGVNITNATVPVPDTAYSFDSLDITTINGTGLVTKNGGTVNFNSPANINASGGAAINLENTAGTTGGVAGSGFTFLDLASINSNANGIRLNDLNSNLRVTGVTNINAAAGPSILITDTNPSPATDSIWFNQVNITSRGNIGVQVDGIFGQVQFQNLNIDNATGVAGNAVQVTNTVNPLDPTGTGSGRVYINGGTISAAVGNGVEVRNALVEINATTITGFGIQGVYAWATAGQVTTVEINNSVITSLVGTAQDAIRLQASGGGIVNATAFTNTLDAPSNALNAIVLDAASSILVNANGNTNLTAGVGPGNYTLSNGGGTLQIEQGSIADLSITNNGVVVIVPGGPITTGGSTPPVPPPTP